MLRHLSSKTSYREAEDRLHAIYDEVTPVILVEVFGPPAEMRYDRNEDAECGPWVFGPKDEVLAYVEASQWDWNIQYEINHTGE